MLKLSTGLIRLASTPSPFRALFAALAKEAGFREDAFARASYIEGMLGYTPGTLVGKETALFAEAREALTSGAENRIVDALRYQAGMGDRDLLLMLSVRDTGVYEALSNGVKAVMKDTTFRGLAAEDVVSAIAAGISPVTGGPLRYGRGKGAFYWLGEHAPATLTLAGIKAIAFKEAKNRALDVVRGTNKDDQNHLSIDAPFGEDGEGASIGEMIEDPNAFGRSNFIELANAIYQDPWVMGILDKQVQKALTSPEQKAVWKAVQEDPSLLIIGTSGIGINSKALAMRVSEITGSPYVGKSSEVSAGQIFRRKVEPAMVEALSTSAVAQQLLRKRHIMEIIQEATRSRPRVRENLRVNPRNKAPGEVTEMKFAQAMAHRIAGIVTASPKAGWVAVIKRLDQMLPTWDASKVTSWNKAYNAVRGKTNDAGGFAHWYSEYRAGRASMEEAIEELEREKVSLPSI